MVRHLVNDIELEAVTLSTETESMSMNKSGDRERGEENADHVPRDERPGGDAVDHDGCTSEAIGSDVRVGNNQVGDGPDACVR